MTSTHSGAIVADLVIRAQEGEAAAWNDLVDGLEGLVWSVVRGYRLSESEAADAAQMVWLRAVEHISSVRDPERFGLWLATTARRECMRIIERARRTTVMAPEDVRIQRVDVRDVATEHANRADVERVVAALATLDDDCQALLRLVLTDPPLSYADISELLGIAVGTIGARRSRCLSRLRAAAGL